jgi:hypothetical protein
VAPPVADAAQHGVPVQRPRAGAGTGGSSPAAARRRRCRAPATAEGSWTACRRTWRVRRFDFSRTR